MDPTWAKPQHTPPADFLLREGDRCYILAVFSSHSLWPASPWQRKENRAPLPALGTKIEFVGMSTLGDSLAVPYKTKHNYHLGFYPNELKTYVYAKIYM